MSIAVESAVGLMGDRASRGAKAGPAPGSAANNAASAQRGNAVAICASKRAMAATRFSICVTKVRPSRPAVPYRGLHHNATAFFDSLVEQKAMAYEIGDEDRSSLASLCGTFRKSHRERALFYFFILFFGLLCPGLFLHAFFEHGMPPFPFSGDTWACLILSITSPAVACVLFCFGDDRHEFDGSVTTHKRRSGTVFARIPISEIQTLRMKDGWGELRSATSSLDIRVTADLAKTFESKRRAESGG